ncbi:hypothetical protein NQD34_015259 [Periophthalmus magnuspinnatus]|nr:hypothetical protein NQD34_015259 [Periophthalmus magnuspinnatus]
MGHICGVLVLSTSNKKTDSKFSVVSVTLLKGDVTLGVFYTDVYGGMFSSYHGDAVDTLANTAQKKKKFYDCLKTHEKSKKAHFHLLMLMLMLMLACGCI